MKMMEPQVRWRENAHMLNPTEALREMYTTAQMIVDPRMLKFMTDLERRLPPELTKEMRPIIEENIRVRAKVSQITAAATPFLWSTEMYDVMYLAASEYPYEGQKWTTDLVGQLPAYHALEEDRKADVAIEQMKSIPELAPLAQNMDPDTSSIFSFLYYRDGDMIRMTVFVTTSGIMVPLNLPLGRLGDEVHVNARLQAGMFEFLRSPYITTQHVRANRPERRRLGHMGMMSPPSIRVVVLRRESVRGETDADHAEVEWSYRWFVRGHWHSYWVGAGRDRHLEPRWLAPYIKGPDDKPLKAPQPTVFKVVR